MKKEIKIKSEHGIHVKDAAEIVRIARKFNSQVYLYHNNSTVNLKSILSVIALAIDSNQMVTLEVNGSDEEPAIEEISYYLENLVEK